MTTNAKRISLTPAAQEIVCDALEYYIDSRLGCEEDEDIDEAAGHHALAVAAAEIIERITGTLPEWLDSERRSAALERNMGALKTITWRNS
jgi:hypothetical protein